MDPSVWYRKANSSTGICICFRRTWGPICTEEYPFSLVSPPILAPTRSTWKEFHSLTIMELFASGIFPFWPVYVSTSSRNLSATNRNLVADLYNKKSTMTVSWTVHDIFHFNRNQARVSLKLVPGCEENISRGNKRKPVYTSSSIFNGGELWKARYLLCSLRKSSTKFGGKFLEKEKKRNGDVTIIIRKEKENGYRSTRDDSNKRVLTPFSVCEKNFKIGKTWWWRMVVTMKILKLLCCWGGSSFFLAEF